MEFPRGTDAEARSLIQGALQGQLSQKQAARLARLDPALAAFAWLAVAACIAGLKAALGAVAATDPATPSGQIPLFRKLAAPRRRGQPGAKPGHPGARREPPAQIDRHQEHRLPNCPACGGPLQRCQQTRQRIIIDIPVNLQTEATEHTIHRDYCPACRKHVEPVVEDALPKATLGHRVVALTAWLHYGLGVTIDQIVAVLGAHLRTRLSAGGLVAMWLRLATLLGKWHDQIAEQARQTAVLHADETGWRVQGRTHWLWCFADRQSCYYTIERCRGSPVLQKFFREAFAGVLVRDFWGPYDAVCARDHQCCLAHLLRELEKVDQRNRSPGWQTFAKKLRRLLHDGIRLRLCPDFEPARYGDRIGRLDERLIEMAETVYTDHDAQRLAKRLSKYRDSVFTFLDYPAVPYDNNHGERQIRPAVIIRKNILGNRSARGAAAQAILMSVFQTLKLRGHDPLQVIEQALRSYVRTGELPPLPESVAATTVVAHG